MKSGWAIAGEGEILSKSDRRDSRTFHVPRIAGRAAIWLIVAHKGKEVALPTRSGFPPCRKMTVRQPADEWKPRTDSASIVLNGVIEQPKASHYFRFDARAGDTFVFRAESMKLGYHLDPTVTVFDAEGKKVASPTTPESTTAPTSISSIPT